MQCDGRQCNSNQKWNNNKCWCKCKFQKNIMCVKKNYIWNPRTCCCENGKYVISIIDDLMSSCDEIIKETKIIPTKTVTAKSTSVIFCILLIFLLITIALLIAFSIYCSFIKYQAMRKPLLPCYYNISKLKETGY